MKELSHFTRGNVLFHAWYEKKEDSRKRGVMWQKIYGSEEVCNCSEREADRQALKEVNRE